MKLDLGPLTDKLEELIVGQVSSTLANDAKMDVVVAAAKSWLDAQLVFRGPAGPILESVTDALIAALPIRAIAQAIFDQLRSLGRV